MIWKIKKRFLYSIGMSMNKKIGFIAICIIMLFALGGCGTNVGDEPVQMEERDIPTLVESESSKNEALDEVLAEAIVNGPFGSIKMAINDSWEYEIRNVDDDKLMNCSYGIHLNPKAESKGGIEIGYCDSFGVCGTGLETKSVAIAGGEAHIGYYDGNDNWNFITWNDDVLKNIVVLSNADWGSDYLDELLVMLNSLEYDKDNQVGGIGVYEVSSELGIDDGWLQASVRNVSSTGATLVLNYSIYSENEAEEQSELYFGTELQISKEEGEEWVPLTYNNSEEVGFEDIAYIIKENEETTYKYDWEWLYGSLEPGKYQIAIEINSEALIYAYFILR